MTHDDPGSWRIACELFLHDPALTGSEEGVQVFGTTLTLRPDQMDAVAAFLSRPLNSVTGGIIALDTGLGKTIVALAVVAVMRVIELNVAVIRNKYLPGCVGIGRNQHCPSGNPFGIQCPCVVNSLSAAIASRIRPAPTLILTPANVVSQFAKQASRYLCEKVNLPGTPPGEAPRVVQFVDVYDTKVGATLTSNSLLKDSIIMRLFKGTPPHYIIPRTGGLQLVGGMPGPGTYQLLYTNEQKIRMRQSHPLIVASSNPNAISDTAIVSRALAATLPIEVKARKKPGELVIPWAISPRLLVVDESHMYKNPDTKLWTLVQSLCSQAYPVLTMALTATPVSVSLHDSLRAVLRVILPAADVTSFLESAKIVDSVIRGRTPQNEEEVFRYVSATEICRDILSRLMTIRRAGDSFHGKAIYPPVHADRKIIRCSASSLSNRAIQDTERLARDAVGRLERELEETRPFLSDQQKSTVVLARCGLDKDFNRSLWYAQFPGILRLSQDLASDPASWLNSDALPNRITDPQVLAEYFSGKRDIDLIMRDCEKLSHLEKILTQAANDSSYETHPPKTSPVRKHVAVFAAVPGEAAIVAAYLQRHHSSNWNVVLVKSLAKGTAAQTVLESFPDIPFDEALRKPTVIVGTTGTMGTGLDTLSRCSYGILFRIPYKEADRYQAFGRVFRYGQRFPVKWFELLSGGYGEAAIDERHIRRVSGFADVLEGGSAAA
ncbi:P-loop containing nucleoside triphosphate hydrolase protein [Rhypophila sp. PSN 637]